MRCPPTYISGCCRELVATYNGARFGYDESRQLVYTDVLHVDVGHKGVQHLALGIAHVALQLRQKRHGTSHRHILKHILLPVLAHGVGVLGQLSGEVALDDAALVRVAHHGKYAVAEGVDGIEKLVSLPRSGCQHHVACSLKVVLALYVEHVGVLAVCLLHNLELKLLGIVV